MAKRFVVVANVPHAESGDTQQHRYESTNARETGAYIVGLSHDLPGREITVTLTSTDEPE